MRLKPNLSLTYRLARLSAGLILAATLGLGSAVPVWRAAAAFRAAAETRTLYLPLVFHNYPLRSVFGVQTDVSGPSNLQKIREANSHWLRGVRIPWRNVERNPGERDWSAVATQEAWLANAAAQGLQPLMMVSHTPTWAQQQAGYACGPINSASLDEFGNFMYDLVRRYSVSPYNIQYYEIWNEPDVDSVLVGGGDSSNGCWGSSADEYYGGGDFADMLQAIYPRVKAANPRAQVLIGGLLSYCNAEVPNGCQYVNPPGSKPYNFFEGILRHHGANDGGQYFDGLDFTAYDFYQGQLGHYGVSTWNSSWNTTGPVMAAKAQFFRSRMSAYGVTGKYLLNTEVALACASLSQEVCESPDFETSKAYYAAQAYATAMSLDLRASIWYSLEGWPQRYTGLMDANGNPRPAYQAYQFVASKLGPASFAREVTDYPEVKGYEFSRPTARIWVLWALDDNAHLVTLPGLPQNIYDVYGQPLSVSQVVTVTLAPSFVEWQP